MSKNSIIKIIQLIVLFWVLTTPKIEFMIKEHYFGSGINTKLKICSIYDHFLKQAFPQKYKPFLLKTGKDSLLIELLETNPVERLKSLNQYGVSHFVKGNTIYKGSRYLNYSRYEHSVNMVRIAKFFCCKKTRSGRSKKFQQSLLIGALLHDIAHGVFSHVLDHVFSNNPLQEAAYHDLNIEVFLNLYGISDILGKYEFENNDVTLKNERIYRAVKPLDRLEYTITGCYLAGILNENEIIKILKKLRFNKKKLIWFFKDRKAASLFSLASIELNKINSASIWNVILYNLTARALKRALAIDLINQDDLLYNKVDNQVWNELRKSEDDEIQNIMKYILNMKKNIQTYKETRNMRSNNSVSIKTKFRCCNPIVKVGGKYKKLTEASSKFCDHFETQKNYIENGYKLKFTDPEHPLADCSNINGS